LDGREDAFGSERKEERAETIASEDELENEQEELILVRERRKRCAAAAAKECAAAENAAAKHTLDVLTRVFIIIESRRRNRIEKERNEYLVHT
jgi:hypothetical protein